jgi:hypothetical protein
MCVCMSMDGREAVTMVNGKERKLINTAYGGLLQVDRTLRESQSRRMPGTRPSDLCTSRDSSPGIHLTEVPSR